MPLFYTQSIDEYTRLGVWEITEPEDFFLEYVPVSRQITHPLKRLQHLAGRFLLQHLFPDFPLSLIQVANTNKPFLPEESHHFSISHCGNYAAAIVSTVDRVGIDIEMPADRLLQLMPKYLHEKERLLAEPHALDQLVHVATILWSAKEAMFKWYGHGEVDFKKHLRIHELNFEKPDSGYIRAAFMKFEEQPMHLSFRCWSNLVLSWLAV